MSSLMQIDIECNIARCEESIKREAANSIQINQISMNFACEWGFSEWTKAVKKIGGNLMKFDFYELLRKYFIVDFF